MNTLQLLDGFTTFATKPSKRRQAEDKRIAAVLAKQNKFAEYRPEINPWPQADLRHERVRRNYEAFCKQYHAYEAIFRDICEAYGYNPDAEATRITL